MNKKLNVTDAITVRTLANLGAMSLRFAKISITPERVANLKGEARAYIESAKMVANFSKIRP